MKSKEHIIMYFYILLFVFISTTSLETNKRSKVVRKKWVGTDNFNQSKSQLLIGEKQMKKANLYLNKAKNVSKPINITIHIRNKTTPIFRVSDMKHFIHENVYRLQDLSAFGSYVLGFYVGDTQHQLRTGYNRSHALNISKCLKMRLNDYLMKDKKYLNSTYIEEFIKIRNRFTPKISKGANTLFKKLKDKESNKKDLVNNDGVKVFLKMIISTINGIYDYMNFKMKTYLICKEKFNTNKKKTQNNNFNLCKLTPVALINHLISSKKTARIIKRIWIKLIKKGYIEKKWKTLNWFDIGISLGNFNSKIIKPICKHL
jgi:hypothetical protein